MNGLSLLVFRDSAPIGKSPDKICQGSRWQKTILIVGCGDGFTGCVTDEELGTVEIRQTGNGGMRTVELHQLPFPDDSREIVEKRTVGGKYRVGTAAVTWTEAVPAVGCFFGSSGLQSVNSGRRSFGGIQIRHGGKRAEKRGDPAATDRFGHSRVNNAVLSAVNRFRIGRSAAKRCSECAQEPRRLAYAHGSSSCALRILTSRNCSQRHHVPSPYLRSTISRGLSAPPLAIKSFL